MRKITKALAGAAVLMASTGQAWAAITFSGDVSAGTGVLELDSDLVFSITVDSTAASFIVFDGWGAPQDGSQTAALVSGVNYANLYAGSFIDNVAANVADITPDDAVLTLTNFQTVVAGSTLTFLADTFSLAATPNFNPLIGGTFTGNIFLTDGSGNRLSEDINVVPIPAAAWLFGSALLGLGVFRRRRNQQ